MRTERLTWRMVIFIIRMCACASVLYCTKISSYLPFTPNINHLVGFPLFNSAAFYIPLCHVHSSNKKISIQKKNTRKRSSQKNWNFHSLRLHFSSPQKNSYTKQKIHEKNRKRRKTKSYFHIKQLFTEFICQTVCSNPYHDLMKQTRVNSLLLY